eukprot:675144-Pleurochrysis_carterae.AAC.12
MGGINGRQKCRLITIAILAVFTAIFFGLYAYFNNRVRWNQVGAIQFGYAKARPGRLVSLHSFANAYSSSSSLQQLLATSTCGTNYLHVVPRRSHRRPTMCSHLIVLRSQARSSAKLTSRFQRVVARTIFQSIGDCLLNTGMDAGLPEDCSLVSNETRSVRISLEQARRAERQTLMRLW